MTRRILFVGILIVAATAAVIRAQTNGGTPFRIEKLDPALDEVIAADAKLETLGDRFALTEGPVWVQEGREGYLLFSDNAANVIYKWAPLRHYRFISRRAVSRVRITRVSAHKRSPGALLFY
jgi:gluconolactonase